MNEKKGYSELNEAAHLLEVIGESMHRSTEQNEHYLSSVQDSFRGQIFDDQVLHDLVDHLMQEKKPEFKKGLLLRNILSEIIEEGRAESIVLSDEDGLALGVAGQDFDHQGYSVLGVSLFHNLDKLAAQSRTPDRNIITLQNDTSPEVVRIYRFNIGFHSYYLTSVSLEKAVPFLKLKETVLKLITCLHPG